MLNMNIYKKINKERKFCKNLIIILVYMQKTYRFASILHELWTLGCGIRLGVFWHGYIVARGLWHVWLGATSTYIMARRQGVAIACGRGGSRGASVGCAARKRPSMQRPAFCGDLRSSRGHRHLPNF